MKRMMLAATVAAFGLFGSMSSPAAADHHNPDGDWVCVHVDDVQVTVCQGDPFPETLPLGEYCHGWTYGQVTMPEPACIVLG